MKIQLNSFIGYAIKLTAALIFVSSCTNTRQAALPDDAQSDIFAISEIPTTSENSPYSAKVSSTQSATANDGMKALDLNSAVKLSSSDVVVPERLKFMFNQLPLSNQSAQQFKITFSVQKDFITAYKIVSNIKEMTVLEKALAVSAQEIQLLSQNSVTQKNVNLRAEINQANINKLNIKNGKTPGVLFVPLFRYKIEDYGVLERTKNELKESTSVLTLKKSEWSQATHVKISAKADNRIVLGFEDSSKDLLDTLYLENKIDNKLMTADELEAQLKFGMKFVDGATPVFTKLDDTVMHVYEVTTLSKLNEQQKRLIKNSAGNQEVISCSDSSVASYIKTTDKDCALLLKADLPINYVQTKVEINDSNGSKLLRFRAQNAPRAQSEGLVQILENTAAKQVDITGILDPNSAVRISDLKGEYFYRRTFEDASNIFLGQTGTSGDMTIIKFELEDERLVVRNQQSLIKYTGQGPKDREELMSFPVKYIRMNKIAADGSALAIPVAVTTTKEKAEYAIIDWTKNTVPDSNSPLAFYSGGECFFATTSQRVTDTDMRLANDGVLNFSITGSYTVKPNGGCVAIKEVNSAYWGGTFQFNFNITERISFMRHTNTNSDIQFAQNISSMAQAAFNYGVFTLADKVKQNGTLDNHDGSEKYMPLIHDFRKGRKIKYYIGGLNNPEATSPERRQLIIDASKQVMDEWNQTLRYAFKGTSLDRTGDYVDLVVDEGNNTGHLGDLDRNYIWFEELQAENGLLGVAQPAANPRSGTIESANVIIYSGNTYDETEKLLKITDMSRSYEKMIETIKQKALADAQKQQSIVETKNQEPNTAVPQNIANLQLKASRLNKNLLQFIQSLQLDHHNIKNMINDMKMGKSALTSQRKISKAILQDQTKGQTINYPINENTFLKKITELSVNKKLTQDPHRLELALNNAFIQYGQLDQAMQDALRVRSQMLAAMIKFDDNVKSRPGCYLYERDDINDAALNLDPDPKKNFELNFKKNIMSTLSHELGHAFGLLHNFKGSIDKANYEFPGQHTGRNYSSIMDYIADIDMKYAGPGPYDAHALRAAYTGMVELSDTANSDPNIIEKLKPTKDNLVSMTDIINNLGKKSFVHFTKDTINKKGLLKYYEQCDDGGMSSSSLCAQFDSGGSATEIVKNLIADYTRSYVFRNYVYDKISFNWPEKIQVIDRNITLFQNIRSYLDEAVRNAIFSPGRTEAENKVVLDDLVNAANLGYRFFHELIRTPDASGVKLTDISKRFIAVPYSYKKDITDASGNVTNTEDVNDIKILEARSLYDVNMSKDKIDTIGIGYDKLFAMQFLMQSSAAQTTDDSRVSMISYLDFEKMFMGVQNPSDSMTLNTILDILSDNLKTGFFTPSANISSDQIINNELLSIDKPVEINRYLGDQTSVASVIGLAEGKWQGYDPFAETFKVSRASVKLAPKDRFSVVRAGEDRSLSDTRVYFASQNAVGAQALIKAAARDEVFITNKNNFFNIMKQLYLADLDYKKPISKLIAQACLINDDGTIKDEKVCKTAQEKSIEEYLKDMPQLVPLKAKADGIAEELVAQLRKFNTNELIMPKVLDKSDSASNFFRQVEGIRGTISDQISMINYVMNILQGTKPKQFAETIQTVSKILSKARSKNDELATSPLISLAQSFIAEYSASIKVKLQDDLGDLTGDFVANILVDKDKLQNQYDKQLEVIDKLSTYTSLVDPDSVLK